MEEESYKLFDDSAQLGLYDVLNKLSQVYADQIPDSNPNLLLNNYGILLKKNEGNHTEIPPEWSDEDILNALYIQSSEYKNKEKVKELQSKLKKLDKIKNTDIYINSIGPVIKMIYSIIINQCPIERKKKYSRLNRGKVWFDTDAIQKYLQTPKDYLYKEEMKFFTLPKIHPSWSEGSLATYSSTQLPSSLTFNLIFKEGSSKMKRDKSSCDLDEGFVTPSDDHKVKTPCVENMKTPLYPKHEFFEWDYKFLSTPPNKYRIWENYDSIHRTPELHFVPKQTKMQYWLSKAHKCVTKISDDKLLDDIMSLLIGISSTTFIPCGQNFRVKDGLYTDNLTSDEVIEMTKEYIDAAEAFLALVKLSEYSSDCDTIICAFKLALKQYLYKYQLMVFQLINTRSNNKSYVCDLNLFTEQVIYLKKVLISSEELKGVTLLVRLFNSMESCSSQNLYLLSYLFLYPCVYYFRLIEDWIFHGRWHKDLPITSCDFSLVEDKQTWDDAYKPVMTDVPWFVPVQDLIYCGKALALLSFSKKSVNFLSMLKGNERPRVELCLQLDDLKKQEASCLEYYEKAKNIFKIDTKPEKEKVDFVLCAIKSAKMKSQAFESSKNDKKINESEKKKIELLLRKEDLIRSQKNKEAFKLEEERIDLRIEEEIKSMQFAKDKQEYETAKEICRLLEEEQIKEEKEDRKVEWNFKRELNNKKRDEFFNENLLKKVHLGQVEHTDFVRSSESDNRYLNVESKRFKEKTLQNETNEKLIKIKSDYSDVFLHLDDNGKKQDFSDNSDVLSSRNHHTEIKYGALTNNRLKVLSSNVIIGEGTTPKKETDENNSEKFMINKKDIILVDNSESIERNHGKSNYKLCKMSSDKLLNLDNETKQTIKNDYGNVKMKYEELTKNRLKISSSSVAIGNGDVVEQIFTNNVSSSCDMDEQKIYSDRENGEMKYEELTENRRKVLTSNVIIGNNTNSLDKTENCVNSIETNDEHCHCMFDSLDVSKIKQTINNGQMKYVELTENRNKVLCSNVIIGNNTSSLDKTEDVIQTGVNCIDTNNEHCHCIDNNKINNGEMKYVELTENRNKVLCSNVIIGNNTSSLDKTEDVIQTCVNCIEKKNEHCHCIDNNKINNGEMKYVELTRNRNKVLCSNVIIGTNTSSLEKTEEVIQNCVNCIETNNEHCHCIDNNKINNGEMKYVELTKNRLKVLSSNVVIGNEKDPQKNENEICITLQKDILSEERDRLLDQNNLEVTDTNLKDFSEKLLVKPSDGIDVNSGVNWLKGNHKSIVSIRNIFKNYEPIIFLDQSVDQYSLLERVPHSLRIVLETQVKLVNIAVKDMFLNEYLLLDEALNLKKYFFICGDFGKKLVTSLCLAVEKEKPTSLLSINRLRDIATFASDGDEKLSFIVKETPTAFEHTNPQVLSPYLALNYTFNWPLNLVFTDMALSKYNDVFEYVFSLERVAWHLDQVWAMLKFKSCQMKGNEYIKIQLYRHIMSQFVCTLRWYIGNTVIENSWQSFKKHIVGAVNLQDLYRKHANLIKEIIFKCFLNEKSSGLMKNIQSILKCILIFCQVMRFGEWSITGDGEYQHINFTKLQNTYISFLKKAKFAVRQIEKLVKINYQEGLNDLYNLLTMNSFYLNKE